VGSGQWAVDRGQRTEDRGQRTEDRGQRTEGRGQRTEGRRQKALAAKRVLRTPRIPEQKLCYNPASPSTTLPYPP
jgi:hypothetical protein